MTLYTTRLFIFSLVLFVAFFLFSTDAFAIEDSNQFRGGGFLLEDVVRPIQNAFGVSSPQSAPPATDRPPVIGIQAIDKGCRKQLGPQRFTPRSVNGGWSAWASDTNSYDPDCWRVYMENGWQDSPSDFRMCIQAADKGSKKQHGAVQCTPWASAGGGWSWWATDKNAYDPDSYRVQVETRSLDKTLVISNARLGIQMIDKGCRKQAVNPQYTPWAGSGGGWSGWATDKNSYDPDCARLFLEATSAPAPDIDENDPAAPSTPTIAGPSAGYRNTSYTFSFRSTDANNDQLRYGVDWDDDNTIDQWSPAALYVDSGTTGSVERSFTTLGSKKFRVLAEDIEGNRSGWASHTIQLVNRRPEVIVIAGPTTGDIDVDYTFEFTSNDPDGDRVQYRIDWNKDGVTDETLPSSGYTQSGSTLSSQFSWPTAGTYTFQAYAVDELGLQSEESWQRFTIAVGVPPACSDGLDNDNDGAIDYPQDIGCSSAADTNERNAQCSDGIDNNGNGTIDYPDDPTCISEHDDNEGLDASGAAFVTLSANPNLVKPNKTTTLSWTVANIEVCTLSGDNGDSWSFSNSSGSVESSALTAETVFTVSCENSAGEVTSATVTVKLAPSFEEN